jgi:hypothetical protein
MDEDSGSYFSLLFPSAYKASFLFLDLVTLTLLETRKQTLRTLISNPSLHLSSKSCTHIQPGGGCFGAGRVTSGEKRLPETLQPMFGFSLTFNSLALARGVPVLDDLVSLPRISSETPYNRVKMAEFFMIPT